MATAPRPQRIGDRPDPTADRPRRTDHSPRVMIGAILAGLAAGYGIAIPVGAIGVLLVSLAARGSWRIGAAAALGVATVDGLYALVATAGGVAVARVIAPIAVRTVVLALRRYRAPANDGAERAAPRSPLRAYAGFLGLTMLNPTTVSYFVALVLGRRGAAMPVGGEVVFVIAAFVASASWQLLLAGGGTVAGRLLTGRRGQLITGLVSGAVIAGLACSVLLAD